MKYKSLYENRTFGESGRWGDGEMVRQGDRY